MMKNQVLELRGKPAETVLSIFKGIVTGEGKLPMQRMDRATLAAIAKEVLETEVDVDALPGSLSDAGVIDGEQLREEILHMGAVLPFLEEDLSMQQERVDALRRLGELWKVKDSMIKSLISLSHGHKLRIMLHAMREARLEAGMPLWKQMMIQLEGVMHLDGDKAVLAKYKEYESLPEGTLGRTMTEYYNQNDFPYPGTSGAPFSNLLLQHDLHHVLSGYNTTGLGEFCVAGFAYGMTGESTYCSVLVVFMFQFHLGQVMDPGANAYRNEYEPAPVFRAFKRGSECTGDYMKMDYDFHPLMQEKLSDIRARFNISADGMLVKSGSDLWCGSEGPPGKRHSG
ncbi:MAG: hypothetical protein ACR2NQ_04985 [Thermodesulfobacteriota bacterium]